MNDTSTNTAFLAIFSSILWFFYYFHTILPYYIEFILLIRSIWYIL